MNWGVYVGPEDTHVVPCDAEGFLLKPHVLDGFCQCDPEVQQPTARGGFLVVHNAEN